ncbi:uracil-DNA glycosylase-like protein [Melanogaster broomeanus]|nr:uracil-DNA glycosylase-like protein [Melanogaster broomeanus]
MADETRVVYLEDVETVVSKAVDTSVSPGAKEKSNKTAAATESSGVKRQRNLMDMLSGPKTSQSGTADEPAVKKARLVASNASSTSTFKIKVEGSSSGLQRLNSIPFSLSQFIASLPEEHKHLFMLECECMGKSWLKVLKDEIKKPYFISLKQFLWEEGVKGPDDNVQGLKVYPSPRNIYSWSTTPLGKVKVVIIGQDPYHGANQAHGLCFSVPKGVAVPPSLRNIYAEIRSEYPEFQPPKHGNLTAWAENGVLMLNTCLTVKANQAGSHAGKGWEDFTDKVVDVVDRYGGANLGAVGDSDMNGIGRGVVFLSWGAWAAKRVAKLNKTKHLILTSAHPSPFSANKGFLGNGHFKAANDWLEKKYGPEGKVNWCRLDAA